MEGNQEGNTSRFQASSTNQNPVMQQVQVRNPKVVDINA